MPGSPDRTSFTPGRVNVSPSDTQGGSRVPELGSLGSVRGALSNGRPYRDSNHTGAILSCLVFSGSAAIITGRRLSGCRRERVRPCWVLAHEPVEVRTR